MRGLIFLIVLLIGTLSFAQKSTSLYGLSGLNRIGVLYELGAVQSFNAHSLSLGLAFYAPDVIFEKNTPGFTINYGYKFRTSKKMKLNAEFGLSLFYENKGDAALLLIDPKLRFGPQWNLNQSCSLGVLAGFSDVFNRSWTKYAVNEEVYLFLNYEMALRFTYRFRNSDWP